MFCLIFCQLTEYKTLEYSAFYGSLAESQGSVTAKLFNHNGHQTVWPDGLCDTKQLTAVKFS